MRVVKAENCKEPKFLEFPEIRLGEVFTTTTKPLWEGQTLGLDPDNVYIRTGDGAIRLSNGVWLPPNGFPTAHNLRLVDCELRLFGLK